MADEPKTIRIEQVRDKVTILVDGVVILKVERVADVELSLEDPKLRSEWALNKD